MAGYIKVSLDTIELLASDLGDLSEEFGAVATTSDSVNSTIGSGTVRDAVDDFASNWKTRRGRLLESIDAVKEMADSSAKAFSSTDLELANELLNKD